MTSAVGGGEVGSPKSRQKKQNQLICDSDKGGEGQISEIFAECHIWKPLNLIRILAMLARIWESFGQKWLVNPVKFAKIRPK